MGTRDPSHHVCARCHFLAMHFSAPSNDLNYNKDFIEEPVILSFLPQYRLHTDKGCLLTFYLGGGTSLRNGINKLRLNSTMIIAFKTFFVLTTVNLRVFDMYNIFSLYTK